MEYSLPNDADGEALRHLQDDGSDLSKPMEIDFHVVVPNQESGQSVLEVVRNIGFRVELVYDEEDAGWTCWCTKTMVPIYEDIVAVQLTLDNLSQPHGGYFDGWSSYGNAPDQ